MTPTEESNQSPTAASSSSHFDEIPEAELHFEGENGFEGETLPPEPEGIQNGRLTREAFQKAFCGTFNITAGLTNLESLAVEESDASASECANAIYSYAEEIPFLNFLIEPGNIHVQRALAIVPFAFFKFKAVQAEAAMKQAAKAEDQQQTEVNQNENI